MKNLKPILRLFFRLIKWSILLLLSVELFSFITITLFNYFIGGKFRDMSSLVVYDPYTIFLKAGGPRPTTGCPEETEDSAPVIWFFGGSTMRGDTVDDSKTIPSLVAADLASRGYPDIRAFNYGENSFGSLQETKYLQKLLIDNPNRPDLVVFYDGVNDSAHFSEFRVPGAHYGLRRLQGLVESYHKSPIGVLKPLLAAVYSSFTRELFEKVRNISVRIDGRSPELLQHAADCRRRYDHVSTLADAYGAEFLLIWQPRMWVENEKILPEEIRQRERDYPVSKKYSELLKHNHQTVDRAILREVKNKPYFVDLRNLLCSRDKPAYQKDGVHLTDYGRELVAGRIARILLDRFGRRLGGERLPKS